MTPTDDREARRLAALERYQILDTPREAAFDEIAELLAAICETPIAVVSFVSRERQFVKAEVGLGTDSVPLSTPFRQHVLLEDEFLLVPDATKDARFEGHVAVEGQPHLCFYAGALLKTADGLPIGTLCVLDHRSRELSEVQERAIRVLARQVMSQLDRRLALRTAARSEARQRAILDSAGEFAIIATDLDGTVIEWSDGAQRVLGWTEADVVGCSTSLIFTEEDRAAGVPEAEMRRAEAEGRAVDERWHLKADGSRFWASGELSPLQDGAGRHIGFVKALRDRTAEHLAGEALKEADLRLRQAQRAGGVGVFHVGMDGILHATPEFCRLYGLEPSPTIPARVFEDLIVPEDRGRVSTAWSGATSVVPLDLEYRIRRADTGELRWVSRRGEIQRDNSGALRFAGVAQDVTERRLAQDALARSEALARENIERVQLALSAGAIIGTWLWDLPSDRFTVDEAFARTFGLDPALGRAGLNLAQVVATVHPGDQAALAEAIDEAIARGGAFAHQYRVQRADGRYYWIEANGRVVHGPDGTPLSFPGVVLDVERRRAVEEERDRATAALRALNETLEQRVSERTAELMVAEEQLRQAQKMEAVGQLTGGLAHDFNNLLAGISGALEMIGTRLSQGRGADVDKYVVAAQGATRRAAALTHRLLAFSRRQTLDPKPTDVNALINGMADLVQRTVGPHIAVETVGAANLWPALVDPSQLENALLNLCINARDAMPDGGRITVETANTWLDRSAARSHDIPEGQYLSLCVTDTGTGMTPEVIARAFDPFFTTKPTGQGTGLGLSMIYGFAKQSGGQVRIYSEVGEGTTVCIYLPRFDGDAADEDAQVSAENVPVAEAGETVLIVDDEPTVRMLVADVLEDLGYAVIEAADSIAGLKILQSDVRIDLLISDVGLPGGMNGRQMADAGRQSRPDLKVLFITGYAENSVIGTGQLQPGMQVLTKPFAVDTLAARIRDLLG